MTDWIEDVRPHVEFRLWPFYLSVGRGGRLFWTARVIRYTPGSGVNGMRVRVVAWLGKWRIGK